MDEDTTNPISAVRNVQRNDLKELRRKHKEVLLGNKRIGLQDAVDCVQRVSLSEFKEMLSDLKKKSVPLQLLRKIKKSCITPEYIETLLRTDGALNCLVRILVGNDAHKQLEAATCLTNIACGPHKCSSKVAKAAGAYLVSFTNGSSHFLQEQSSWALANIANDCKECFNVIKAQGVLPALITALRSPSASVVECVVFALNACTQYEDPEVTSVVESSFVESLLSILEREDLSLTTKSDAAFTLSHCCYLSSKYILNCFGAKSTERIVKLFLKVSRDTEADILVPLLRCLGYLSWDNNVCNSLAAHPELLESLQKVIAADSCSHLSKEVFWVLSNITAGTSHLCTHPSLMPVIDGLTVADFRLDSATTLQALYFLSILASRDESLRCQLRGHSLCSDIKSLLEKENENLREAATVFLEIVQC